MPPAASTDSFLSGLEIEVSHFNLVARSLKLPWWFFCNTTSTLETAKEWDIITPYFIIFFLSCSSVHILLCHFRPLEVWFSVAWHQFFGALCSKIPSFLHNLLSTLSDVDAELDEPHPCFLENDVGRLSFIYLSTEETIWTLSENVPGNGWWESGSKLLDHSNECCRFRGSRFSWNFKKVH